MNWACCVGRIKRLFVRSSQLHLREAPARSTRELVALVDRFLDDRLSYPLEWDDFISWRSDVPAVEKFRTSLSEKEHWLFSDNEQERAKYVEFVTRERNRLAAQLGIVVRKLRPANARRSCASRPRHWPSPTLGALST